MIIMIVCLFLFMARMRVLKQRRILKEKKCIDVFSKNLIDQAEGLKDSVIKH